MTLEPAPNSSAEDLLQAFAVNTMALDAVVVGLAQAERALVAKVQAGADGSSVREFDTTDLALRLAGERVPGLVQMHERLGRTLRLTLALQRRIETGWPRRGEVDDRRAMARRQVERAVGAQIRAAFDEPAERLRMLEERLWDPGVEAMLVSMPVEDLIAEIGRELTAARAEVASLASPRAGGEVASSGPYAGFAAPAAPHPGPLQKREREKIAPRRAWPAGMVNPPPGGYAPWRLDHDEGRRRVGRRPDD